MLVTASDSFTKMTSKRYFACMRMFQIAFLRCFHHDWRWYVDLTYVLFDLVFTLIIFQVNGGKYSAYKGRFFIQQRYSFQQFGCKYKRLLEIEIFVTPIGPQKWFLYPWIGTLTLEMIPLWYPSVNRGFYFSYLKVSMVNN